MKMRRHLFPAGIRCLFWSLAGRTMRGRRTGRRKNCISAIVLCVALLLTACKGGSSGLRLGTGDEGGTYYTYSTHMSELLKPDPDLQIKTTAGSVANLRLMKKDFLDLSIVQSDILARDSQEDAENVSYSAVAGLYTEALQIVVRQDSGIREVEDLKGRTVSLGEEESGVRKNAEEVLRMAGIKESDVEQRYLSFTDSAALFKEGKLDAFFVMAGVPTKAVENLAKDTKLRLISISEDAIRFLKNLNPEYTECTIPAGCYEGQDEAVRTVGVRAVLVVSNSMGSSEVKKLTEKILSCSGELNREILTDDVLTPEVAAKNVPIPFHPGAAEYLKEQGVEVQVASVKTASGVFGGQDEGGAK